jgi:AraC-like DNA-binding protein
MVRRRPSLPLPLHDTDPFRPTRQRPVRVRARTIPADTHFEPHRHAWAQLAWCASGILQVSAAASAAANDQVTYMVPPSRAVWIAPGALHSVHVVEEAALGTLYIDASAAPPGFDRCRVIVVSPLLRELVHALDAPPDRPLPREREALLAQVVQDEIARADTQALGVPLPPAQGGDKRLRALCEAVLRSPSERATLAQWAAGIGASERTLARLFRDQLGTNFQQWRQQAILAASGYASDSAFSAMFKAAMGQPPSHFQRREPG